MASLSAEGSAHDRRNHFASLISATEPKPTSAMQRDPPLAQRTVLGHSHYVCNGVFHLEERHAHCSLGRLSGYWN
jgi:hypothetical protein